VRDLILIRLKSNNILYISGVFLWASSRLFLDDTSLGYSNQDDKRNIDNHNLDLVYTMIGDI
jgi:hypothetical protein